MPPPPEAEEGPGQAFLEGEGHWVWSRDEGFSDLQCEYRGFIGSTVSWLTEAVPEQWFTKLSEARWELKTSSASYIWKNGGSTTDLLEIGRESTEKMVTGLDGRDYRGYMKAYWEGDKLCIHTYGNTRTPSTGSHCSGPRHSKLDFIATREIVNGEYHFGVEDKVTGLKGLRIYKQYPYYKIDNQTRKTLQLSTYYSSDFVYCIPAMRKEVSPGISIIEASGGRVEEEQGFFTISVRDSTAGSEEKHFSVTLKAFETYTLTLESFA